LIGVGAAPWFDEPDPDFVIAGPDLLPGLPATPAPLCVFDCANAVDEAIIAASTIAIVRYIAFPPLSQCNFVALNAVYLGNDAGSPSFR
jgi:hypothetical protein